MKNCLILALLMLAWTVPASAQRASLADRVAALEAQAATEAQGTSQSNIELLNRTTQMQDEIRALRATIEQLQNELEQNRQRNREQYIDMDSRVSALEQSGATGKPSATPTTKPAAGRPDVSGKPPAFAAAPAAGESADYQAAYNSLIKQGDAMTSAKQFQAFLETYPDSRLAPNAWYWLGESYYALGSYELALKSFGILLEQYGDSGKAPDALLKSGYCQLELKNTAAGKQTLEQVIAKYPTSPVAEMARSRLRGLSLDR
jgi:tol-pal system protein YbgF